MATSKQKFSTAELEKMYAAHFKKMAEGNMNSNTFYKMKSKHVIPSQKQTDIKLVSETANVVARSKANLKRPNNTSRAPRQRVYKGHRKSQVLKEPEYDGEQSDIFA